MTLSVIDFLRESSRFLAMDRPDVFENEAHALDELIQVMDRMRDTPGSGLTTFGDYMLVRYQDEDTDEWELARRMSSVVSFSGEDRVWVFSHTQNSQALRWDIELPDPDDDEEV